MRVLAINPGSTSTKVALYEDGTELWSDTQRYSVDDIKRFPSISDQEEFRRNEIRKALDSHNTDLSSLDAAVGRGGLLKPIPGGTYVVNEPMLDDLRSCRYGSHACNLGAPLAIHLAQEGGCNKAFIVDPVVVDEMIPEARLSGLPEIERRSLFHALNQKAVARRAAAEIGKKVDDCNFIVAHMGGGVSVGAHDHGRVVDVNNALDGEGPFSPERSGSLPAGGLVHLAFSGEYDLNSLLKRMVGGGGLVAHLGTNDLREVQRRIVEDHDEKASLIFEAQTYQISKEIGACSAVLKGCVDAIVLTGGLAYSEMFVEKIRQRVSFIAPVIVYPGEDEMKALAEGALRVLQGVEKAKEYR
ncbi:MAG: butyrate kinase [Aminobacterium sp.]|jgi:butyrate kinase|uniref:butyrate kinase n=1 Tax=Aminobacterium sp. MB27-C1 TaxID=3070661 RepID=UPI001BD11D15|nr:butyrate kinase [Aminobacterium sp. MB27-C1]MDD2206711.1 butyrate kinase [Aminobacterium sp.]MDD3425293.1 butyrate kinase [Aminobacterium sp.]MDD3706870.1 butyrate kinase [Aminobacterium sp.]MDD4228873.1 butyrate kinase [Aminobacterium sp.]MDD4551070.1 butyrate kinase [Aminobacterium sp.]